MSDPLFLPAVFVLRALQAAILCLPTLLCGLIVAGVIRALIGRERLASWFNRGTVGDLLRAWAVAFFLPVCSIGVWPVLLTMRSMGVRLAPLVVIAIAAPLVTPWTLGYLFDSAGPMAATVVIASNAAIALLAGIAVGKRHQPVAADSDESMPSRSALLNILWFAARSLDRRELLLIAFALFGVGAVAVCIPANMVGEWLVERELLHTTVISAISLVSYVPPELAAMQAGEAINASTTPGLVVPLIALGAAIHLGTLVALVRSARPLVALRVAGIICAIAFACGLVMDVTFRDHSYEPEDTHAFEDYGRPFHLLDHRGGKVFGFIDRLKRPLGVQAVWAGAGVVALLVVGRAMNRRDGIPPTFASRLSLRTSFAVVVLGTTALAAYTYFPPPNVIATDLRAATAELVVASRRDEHETILRVIHRLDRRLSQYTVARTLHGQPPTAEQRDAAARLRSVLSDLAKSADQARMTEFSRDMSTLTKGLD